MVDMKTGEAGVAAAGGLWMDSTLIISSHIWS